MKRRWWQRAVIYQIYVRSFFDADGDGVGDLTGLVRKLDYIGTLGVEAVWLSPIFPSPRADAGYDVTDFCGIHPQLGTLQDFDCLVDEAHRRGIRIVIDWPVNHTSDQHPWFEEARSSRDSRHRNWYVWADPNPDGAPPNNWLSVFGGSAWTLDEKTRQCHFHAFLPQQPDLNWREPAVPTAIHDAMRFWLARGVDGFHVDAVDMLLENPDLPDNPPNPSFDPNGPPDAAVFQVHNRSQPGVHECIAALRRVCSEFGDRVLLGEVYTSLDNLVSYYGTPAQPELHLPLNPELLNQRWDAAEIAHVLARYVDAVSPHGWPNWAWSNHDFHRLGSRAKPEQLRVAAMLLLTQRGTPFVYYGEEIGMHDVEVPPEFAEDPQGRAQPRRNRDVARTPMQWNDGPNGGFTSGPPFSPVADDYGQINVASQERDPRSLLAVYRRLIELRKAEPALTDGLQTQVLRQAALLFFRRELPDRRLLVVFNMSGDHQVFDLSECGPPAHLLLSTFLDRDDESPEREVRLRGYEGIILALEGGTGLRSPFTGK
jgi:alpha-glucosidase